jgi:tetratricopeptide (TPR) repeat protein
MFITNTTLRRTILFVALIISIAGTVAAQQPASSAPNGMSQQVANDAAAVFRSARDFITDGEWSKAYARFNDYVQMYPNGKNIEAALYWLAYSQHKLGRYDQARSTVDRLLQKYPQTTWKDDARVLLAQTPGIYAAAVADQTALTTVTPIAIAPVPAQGTYIYTPDAADAPLTIAATALESLPPGMVGFDTTFPAGSDDDPCEFKIVVLQALFQTDLQRGIMAATDWLKPGSNQTERCKSAALTLLGRSGGKAATPVILGVARNEPHLKLRARAISTLATTNDDTVIDPLRDFALNSESTDIMEAALYALSRHTSDRAINVLSEIATSGKVTAHRKLAIASIASRSGEPAVDALFRIYDADQSIEIRKAVISGFANRKSERVGARLVDIARSSDNVELRKSAISAISRRGGDKAIDFLLSLYDAEKNEEVKDQILNSLASGSSFFFEGQLAYAAATPPGQHGFSTSSRMNDQRVIRKLIEIARSPQAPMERRKRAIGWLSRSKDPEVLKFLEELLK